MLYAWKYTLSQKRNRNTDTICNKITVTAYATLQGKENNYMILTVRQLDKSKIQIYLDILMERAMWLESINKPMWNIDNLNPVNFEKMYPDYTPYLIYLGDQIIGGFVLLTHDRFLWNEEENNHSALYIHNDTTRGHRKFYASYIQKWGVSNG